MKSTYLLPWFKMTTWYFRLSRLLEVSNVKRRTKNHSADADRIFMLVKNHVLAVSGRGDEAPPTPGGRNGGRDVPSLWIASASRSLPNWNFHWTDFCRLRAAYIFSFTMGFSVV